MGDNLREIANNVASMDLDAFGRLRVSQAYSLFDSQHQYNDSSLFWNTALTGAATTTHLPNESALALTVTNANADRVIYQTKQYFRYQPGKSQALSMSFVFGTGRANCTQRVGYYDDNNGIFLQLAGTTLSVVRRYYTGGIVSEETVNQASWNIDKLTGSGPSGLTLDITKVQILSIDLQWLGAGRVRIGLNINGTIIPIHQFIHANILVTTYMTTANLPVRYEIVNIAGTSGSTTMKAIGTSVHSSSAIELSRGLTHTSNNGTTSISVSTRRAILTIRPKATFNGIVNRGLILPLCYNLFVTGTDHVFYEIVLNGALGGAPAWVSCGTNSLVERDVSGTTVTGGEIIDSGYQVGNGAGASAGSANPVTKDILRDVPLTLDIAGVVPETLSIVVTSLAGATATYGSMTFKEYY